MQSLNALITGSPPLTRGLLGTAPVSVPSFGITPAHAGTTTSEIAVDGVA